MRIIVSKIIRSIRQIPKKQHQTQVIGYWLKEVLLQKVQKHRR